MTVNTDPLKLKSFVQDRRVLVYCAALIVAVILREWLIELRGSMGV